MSLPKVIIIGGGFAGLAAARKLRCAVQRGLCEATLIDSNPETSMVPALPDYAAGLIPHDWVTAPIHKHLPSGITFLHDCVTGFSLEKKIINTKNHNISFDYLIVALGSQSAPPPDILQNTTTHTITNIADATVLKKSFDHLLATSQAPSVVINGAGYTGIELAICMARRATRDNASLDIHLVEQREDIMTFLPPKDQQRVLRSIKRHGIKLHKDCHISSVQNDKLQLSNGTTIISPMICRTEGTVAPVSAAEQNIPQLYDGRIQVQPTLALEGFPHVLAAGDAAAFSIPNGYLRKAVNFAFYAGAHAGMNVVRALQNRPMRPFKPIDLGWVIPLGNDSVGQAFGSLPLKGKMGLRMHYVMCGYRNYSLKNFYKLLGHAVRAGT